MAQPVSGEEPMPSPLSLEDVLAAVRRRNPMLAARRETANAAAIRPRAEGLPDDPMLMLEWWQQPVNFSMVPIMVTARQKVPWPGTLRLQREAAAREARTVRDEAEQAERQALADAKRAWFDLALAERSLEVNDRVHAIDAHLVEVTEALYRVGKAIQADLFKAQTERLTVENERADLERVRDDAVARLNALLDRPPGAPLGPTSTLVRLRALPSERDLVERALATRPELKRARDQLAAAEARVAVAQRQALPELSVWAAYMANFRGVDTFTMGVSSSLPFFSSRRKNALVDAGQAEVQASRRALDAARRDAEQAVHSALLQLEVAARHVHLHADKLVPLADLTLESDLAAYQAGRADFLSVLDAARMVRDHHLNHIRFLVDYSRRLADLEQVAGDLDADGAMP
jgi:outer membrane protein TolC